MATVNWYPPLPIVDEVDRVVARWRALSHSVNPALCDDMWATPACRALVAAIIAGDDPTPALRRYASHREFACVLQSEAIADLTCLVSVEPRAEIIDTLTAGAEIAEAFRSAATDSALDGLAGLPGLPYMVERLDEEYRRVLATGDSPAAVLELRCYLAPGGRGLSSFQGTLATAEFLRKRYPSNPVGCLTDRLFAVLTWRDGRESHVGSDDVPSGVRAWREALPDESERMRGLLTELVDG